MGDRVEREDDTEDELAGDAVDTREGEAAAAVTSMSGSGLMRCEGEAKYDRSVGCCCCCLLLSLLLLRLGERGGCDLAALCLSRLLRCGVCLLPGCTSKSSAMSSSGEATCLSHNN